ncbi:MAG: threonine--tRNA ligase [Bacilli bacterium]|nr:threonine--tRNA ligase [Bacilli bacterium]
MNKICVELLKTVINNKYHNIKLDDIYYDDNEFYYEFKADEQISENDFEELEKEIKKLNNNVFVKLLRISGVYYKGDASKEMITKIVGKGFSSKEEIEEYNKFLLEAAMRDHRKIGQDLDLFCFSDYVGAGLPLYTPRGTIVKDELQKEIEKVCRKYGFEKVSCPSLANISLFETSGHAAKFNDELFRVESPKGHEFVLKPVQCPHHTQIYASRLRSYKDLPIRYMESDKQYRAELQGAVGNSLSRVYAITVEDGHSFCRRDQVKQEVINMCNLIKDFYSRMGLWDNNWVSLSVRDYDHPEKYIGKKEDWDICEEILQEVSDELGLNAKRCEGEAALYGPKLDFMFKDALGREIQIPTVQLDFATPKRFDLFYIDENGEKQNPVMVHRAVLGSYERFLVLLLEQFKGVLPIWLSPVQVNIVPINMKYHDDYCNKIKNILLDEDIRVNYDDSDDRFNKKIMNSSKMKNPYTLIIGDKERDNDIVSYKKYGKEETNQMEIDEFVKFIKEEIKKR